MSEEMFCGHEYRQGFCVWCQVEEPQFRQSDLDTLREQIAQEIEAESHKVQIGSVGAWDSIALLYGNHYANIARGKK